MIDRCPMVGVQSGRSLV